jgi:aldos-2-ulose dehydratase/isomerase family protein/VCBS repeat protein
MKIPTVLILAAATGLCAAPPEFRDHLIAEGLTGGYQVRAIDVDRDGDPDLVALASRVTELLWFENPGWKKHVMSSGRRRMINLATCGEDADGYPVFVLAEDFENIAAKSTGTVYVVERAGNVKEEWKTSEIDRLPTSHRMRCADIDGSGELVYVNSPLIGEKSLEPDFRDPTPLVYYRPGEWKRELIGDKDSGVVHGIRVIDFDGDGRDEILTASFAGIHLYDWTAGKWAYTEIAKGDPAPWPKSGASEITVGELGGMRFLATIEPWHGDKVAVYIRHGESWQRQVIDDSFVSGHTVVAHDLNGDGRDEIIAGYRSGDRGIYIYEAADETGLKWTRHTLDKEKQAADACTVADLNADGLPDIACIGSSTASLSWYEQIR